MSLRAPGTTILFVSHETSDVKALCERCLWLDNGVPRELGEADDVVAAYLTASLRTETRRSQLQQRESGRGPGKTPPDFVPAFENIFGGHRFGDGRATILGADLVDHSGHSVRDATPRDLLFSESVSERTPQ